MKKPKINKDVFYNQMDMYFDLIDEKESLLLKYNNFSNKPLSQLKELTESQKIVFNNNIFNFLF
jgi:hypothetical protein